MLQHEPKGAEGAVEIGSPPRRCNFTFSSVLSTSPTPLTADTRPDAVNSCRGRLAITHLLLGDITLSERNSSGASICPPPSVPGPTGVGR